MAPFLGQGVVHCWSQSSSRMISLTWVLVFSHPLSVRLMHCLCICVGLTWAVLGVAVQSMSVGLHKEQYFKLAPLCWSVAKGWYFSHLALRLSPCLFVMLCPFVWLPTWVRPRICLVVCQCGWLAARVIICQSICLVVNQYVCPSGHVSVFLRSVVQLSVC